MGIESTSELIAPQNQLLLGADQDAALAQVTETIQNKGFVVASLDNLAN